MSGYTTDCHDGCLATKTHAAANCPTMSRKAPSKGKLGFKMLTVLRFRNPAARNHGPLNMGFMKTHDTTSTSVQWPFSSDDNTDTDASTEHCRESLA